MRHKSMILLVLGFWLAGWPAPSPAELVTSAASIPGPNYVINFSQFTDTYPTPSSPVQVGALVGKNVTMENCNEYGDFSFSLGYGFHTPQNGY